MLLAARALTFLADVFPPAASAIIRHGAVPALCARLLTIEYIDLAEQSLQVGATRPLCATDCWVAAVGVAHLGAPSSGRFSRQGYEKAARAW
jgi:hypothetical protein